MISIPYVPSDKFLRDNLECAMFDQALWDLLKDLEVRNYYRTALASYYNMKIEKNK